MKPEEVMVGNYVYDTWDDEVRQIYPVDVLNIENGRDIFEPIKIAREWLDKLGFRKDDTYDHVWVFPNNDSLRLWGFAWNIQQFMLVPNDFVDINMPSIKYVHQLQNCVYLLTGNQLTIVTDK